MPAYLDQNAMDALSFFSQWLDFTRDALSIVAPKCPLFPTYRNKANRRVHKTRPWLDSTGPVGIIEHYTGGPNGIASMRWGNENSANNNSSWHCTVLDHKIAALEEARMDYPLVGQFLPVTALLHADIHKSTWHGNWTNSLTFGIEHRNLGMLTGNRDGRPYRPIRNRRCYPIATKPAIYIRNRYWESYTKEQLIASINIGKMLRAWRGCKLDPSWILPHSAVWATKSDTGAAFPIELVRDAIFSDMTTENIAWLNAYGDALIVPYLEVDDDYAQPDINDVRDGEFDAFDKAYRPVNPVEFDHREGKTWRMQLPQIRDSFRALGYHMLQDYDLAYPHKRERELEVATNIFQKSTHAPNYRGAKLSVDGIPGKKTLIEIDNRLEQLGYL